MTKVKRWVQGRNRHSCVWGAGVPVGLEPKQLERGRRSNSSAGEQRHGDEGGHGSAFVTANNNNGKNLHSCVTPLFSKRSVCNGIDRQLQYLVK